MGRRADYPTLQCPPAGLPAASVATTLNQSTTDTVTCNPNADSLQEFYVHFHTEPKPWVPQWSRRRLALGQVTVGQREPGGNQMSGCAGPLGRPAWSAGGYYKPNWALPPWMERTRDTGDTQAPVCRGAAASLEFRTRFSCCSDPGLRG